MSSKKPRQSSKSKKFDNAISPLAGRRQPANAPPPLPPTVRTARRSAPAAPSAPSAVEPARWGSRAYVWLDGERVILPTAWLQHRMSALRHLDDAKLLYSVWLEDYKWWSGGSLPANPQDSFRKAVAGCKERLLRGRGSS